MSRKVLVINVNHSGMNPYLINGLKQQGINIMVHDITVKSPYRYVALISSFHWNMQRWKSRLDVKMGTYYKNPKTFISRTKSVVKGLKQYAGNYDLIFQFSSMFSHYVGEPKKPYVVFIDWTRSLSEREYPAWAPIKSRNKVKNWLKLEGNLYRNASFVFTPSEYTRKSLVSDYGIDPSKAITVGYGPPLDQIPPDDFEKEYGAKTILFVGYDFERKGGLVLLEAFKKVKEEIADVKLIMITRTQLKTKIEQGGAIFVDSRTPRKEILKFFKQASVFAMPSFCEPFGLVFLEAMSYKLPCIGTNIDAMPEIIHNDKTGFVISPGDHKTLSKNILSLLNDQYLMKNMGQKGYQYLKSNFTWDKVGEKIDRHLSFLYDKDTIKKDGVTV